MRLLLSAIASLTLVTPVLAQTPEAERTIVSTVVAEHDRHIALLERIVNQNSGTLNAEGVRATAEMVRADFDDDGDRAALAAAFRGAAVIFSVTQYWAPLGRAADRAAAAARGVSRNTSPSKSTTYSFPSASSPKETGLFRAPASKASCPVRSTTAGAPPPEPRAKDQTRPDTKSANR